MKKTLIMALAILFVGRVASAGEIILVDPLSGSVTRGVSPGGRDAAIDSRTGADRARARINPEASPGMGGIIMVQPTDRVGPPATSGDAGADARRGARDARLGAGDEDSPAAGLDPNAIVIIENGQARVLQQGERIDALTRMKIDNAKAKTYQRGAAPCGSVVVGGIGEGSAPSSTSQTRDVYVNNNCR